MITNHIASKWHYLLKLHLNAMLHIVSIIALMLDTLKCQVIIIRSCNYSVRKHVRAPPGAVSMVLGLLDPQ